MEVGISSLSGLLLRFLKLGDMVFIFRGNFVIFLEGIVFVFEEYFFRSDSVLNFEDLIVGDF